MDRALQHRRAALIIFAALMIAAGLTLLAIVAFAQAEPAGQDTVQRVLESFGLKGSIVTLILGIYVLAIQAASWYDRRTPDAEQPSWLTPIIKVIAANGPDGTNGET